MAKRKDFEALPTPVKAEIVYDGAPPKIDKRDEDILKNATSSNDYNYLSRLKDQLHIANDKIALGKDSLQFPSELKYFLQGKELLLKVHAALKIAQKWKIVEELEEKIMRDLESKTKEAITENNLPEALKYMNLLKVVANNDAANLAKLCDELMYDPKLFKDVEHEIDDEENL